MNVIFHRTESGTLGAGDSETQDDEKWIKRKKSLFGTVLRSKVREHQHFYLVLQLVLNQHVYDYPIHIIKIHLSWKFRVHLSNTFSTEK